jgi:hypothetical protein
LLRRFWNHISRSRARAGLMLAAVSVLAYAELPDTDTYEPWKQFALILAGVAASAIFLPELSSDLWTISSDQVRKLIPDSRRQALARALIDAESLDQEWNELVYTEALLPMMQAGREPWLNLRNVNYAVRVHLDQPAPVPELGPTAHTIDTAHHAERVFPPPTGDGSYWVAIARSSAALATEFEQPSCLSRELVQFGSMSGHAWYDKVLELCRVGVVVNGQDQVIEIDQFNPSTPDVVRYKFRPELEAALTRVPVGIRFDFPVPATTTTFPVIFSGYYCGGATVLTLKVHHGDTARDLECDAFLARRLGTHPDRNRVTQRDGPGWREMSFGTGRDSVMWPGSGVVFSWRSVEDQTTMGG